MNEELLEKINRLARKKKEVGLTDKEEKLQKELREQYLKLFRKSFRKRLENIDVEYID